EVLPLESLLMQFLRHNWKEQGDVEDILHDVYIRVYEAACRQIPDQTKPFVFTTARNLLISRVRKRQVIPIEAVADLDALGIAMDSPGPDRSAIARGADPAPRRRAFARRDRVAHECERGVRLRLSDGRHVCAGRSPLCGAGRKGMSEDREMLPLADAKDAKTRAAAWLERRDRADWSESDQAELDKWLVESPGNLLAYWRVEAAWDNTNRLIAVRPFERRPPAPDTRGKWIAALVKLVAGCAAI